MAKRESNYSPAIRDLVAEGGTASRAQDLIQATADAMPHELRRAQQMPHYHAVRQRRINEVGEGNVNMKPAPQLELDKVAANAGLEEGQVADASVHGRSLDDAWVVYVAFDELGAPFHGTYKLDDHASAGKAKSHVSVAESFGESELGKRLIEQREASVAENAGRGSTRTRRSAADADEALDGDPDGE